MPVPPDGATNVQPDADLMFLGGSGAAGRHRVLVGASADALSEVATLDGDANIATPPAGLMGALATVYWRVDMQPGGDTSLPWLAGPVWSFRVQPLSPPPSPPAPPPPPCVTLSSTEPPQFVRTPGGPMGP